MVSLGESGSARAHSLSPTHKKPVAVPPRFRSPQPYDGRKKKVTKSDVDELKQSMHEINQRVEKKGGIFGFFRRRKDSTASDEKKSPKSPDPPKRRGRKPGAEWSSGRASSDRPRSLSPVDRRHFSPTPGQAPMTVQPSHKKKVVGREVADELKQSMHAINMRLEAKKKRRDVDTSSPSPGQKTSKPLMKKLGLDMILSPKGKKATISSKQKVESTQAPRPSLRPEIADELKKSVHQRIEAKASRRQQIMNRILLRRQEKAKSSSSVSSAPSDNKDDPSLSSGSGFAHDASEQQESDLRLPTPPWEEDDRETRRREAKEHIGRRKEESKGKKKRKSKTKTKERLQNTKKGVAFSLSSHSESSFVSTSESFANEPVNRKYKKINLRGQLRGLQGSQHGRENIGKSDHSADTFMASFSDDNESTTNFLDWKRNGASRSEENDHRDESSSDDSFPEFPDGDFDAYKREWARLIRKKKRMKRDVLSSKKRVALLSSEVDALSSERDDLKKQLKQKNEKISRISSVQAKDRTTFDNSTDLIAQARVDLAKSLNEKRTLRSKIDDLEESLAEKDARIRSLSEMIELQSDKIDDMVIRLRDCDVELRYNLEEKRKIEDELAVIVAAQNGEDLGDVFRMLEEERENWMDDRERDLEERRIALDEENDALIERERVRYQRESDDLVRASQRQRARDEEQKRISKKIEKQLSALRKENKNLQERINSENLEMTVELKDKEHNIALLEQQVSKLKKKVAKDAKTSKIKDLRSGEVHSLKDDLKDSQKHNRVLEKQIKKMEKEMDDLRYQANNWQEVVLPGHRGITFGNTTSDSLAGFLTILVAEESKKHSKKERNRKSPSKSKSKDLKKDKKRRRDREKKSKKETKKKSKNREKEKKKSDKRKKKDSRRRSSTTRKEEKDKKSKRRSEKKDKKKKKSSRRLPDDVSNVATKQPKRSKSRSRSRDRTPSAILLQ